MAKSKWIQDIDIKKGALHKQLGIPEDEKIPMSLLEKILIAKPGDKVTYYVDGKKKEVKVTPLLQRRARLAKTFKEMRG